MYAYVGDNPTTLNDPSGLTPPALPAAADGDGCPQKGSDNCKKAQAQQQSPYQSANREANVIYHETSDLRTINGKSNSGNLHGMRGDAAHVYNNLTNKSAFQDSGTLNRKEQQALAGGYAPAVSAYNDSLNAVSEAAHQADTTNGSTHFFVRDMTAGAAQHVPSWANGNQIVFGPFRTTANGDGPIHAGDTVYIWINNTR